MSHREFRRIALVVLLVWVGSPAFADVAPRRIGSVGCLARSVHPAADAAGSPIPVVLADSWGIGKFVAGGGRARIVQICVAVMCIALFIMMRKLR